MLEQLAVLHVITDDELLSGDPEIIHDFRVAVRTLRTRLKFFAPYFKHPSQIKAWSKDLRWLDKHVQRVRDIDVQIETLQLVAADKLQSLISKPSKYNEFRSQVLDLGGELNGRSEVYRQNLTRVLTSTRKRELFAEFKTGLLRADIKAKRVRDLGFNLHEQLALHQSKINATLGSANFYRKKAKRLHELRLECKRARYLAQSIGVDASRLATTQELLGRINDLSLLNLWLEKHLYGSQKDRKTILALMMATSRYIEMHRSELSQIAYN